MVDGNGDVRRLVVEDEDDDISLKTIVGVRGYTCWMVVYKEI